MTMIRGQKAPQTLEQRPIEDEKVTDLGGSGPLYLALQLAIDAARRGSYSGVPDSGGMAPKRGGKEISGAPASSAAGPRAGANEPQQALQAAREEVEALVGARHISVNQSSSRTPDASLSSGRLANAKELTPKDVAVAGILGSV